MEALKGGKQIGDVYNSILDAQSKLTSLESVLKTDIVNAINYSTQSIASSVGSAVNNAYSRGYSAGGGGSVKVDKMTPNNEDKGKDNASKPSYAGNVCILNPYGNQITTDLEKTGSQVYVTDKNGQKTWQNIWRKRGAIKADINGYLIWKDKEGKYVKAADYIPFFFPMQLDKYYDKNGKTFSTAGRHIPIFKKGGLADYTGPAWLDGTQQKPEAVLNALQTEHFIKFTNALDNMFDNRNTTNTSSSINIENISFNVESMSSPEDGEAAFNMFVNKFKEIGSQTGIKMNSFKNTL